MSVNLHVTLPQLAIFSAKLTTGHLGKLEIKTKNSESHIAQSFATFQRGMAGEGREEWWYMYLADMHTHAADSEAGAETEAGL